MTTLTWNDVAKIAKKIQKQYKLPIFAMTYKGTCSCCASPTDFHASAYLTKDVRLYLKMLITVTVKLD